MDPLVFYGGLGTVNGFIVAVIGHWLFGQLWHLTNAELSSKLLEVSSGLRDSTALAVWPTLHCSLVSYQTHLPLQRIRIVLPGLSSAPALLASLGMQLRGLWQVC